MPLSPDQEVSYSRYGMYPYNWIVDGKVIASVYPIDDSYLGYMRNEEGITLAINLTESPWSEGWERSSGIRCLHFPVIDMATPRPSDVRRIIDEIDRHNGPVMVHCAAGIGRTGTVIGLYLVHHGMDPLEAIRTVRKKRPGSIQTRSQESMIMKWSKLGRC